MSSIDTTPKENASESLTVSSAFILASGPGWIAIDKPAGMSVHNDPAQNPSQHQAQIHGHTKAPRQAGSFASSDFALDAISSVQKILMEDADLRKSTHWQPSDGAVSPVHRLDRETSGVLLLATNRAVASRLQIAFAERQAQKNYVCITRQNKKQSDVKSSSEVGSWHFPLSDKAEGRRKPQGASQDRKPAVTDYQVLRKNPYLSMLFINLQTGRQHQIRRHALLAGSEICGDRRYGDLRYNENLEKRFGFSRLMLHAVSLCLETAFEKIDVVSVPAQEFRLMLPEAADLDLLQSKEGAADFLRSFQLHHLHNSQRRDRKDSTGGAE